MTPQPLQTTTDAREALTDPGRLDAIESLGLGLAEGAFDRASRLASRALCTSVGLVSIVTHDRQLFAGRYGLGEPWATTRQTPLSHSFCKHVVVSGQPVAVENAPEDERVRDNLAIRDLDVVAYLGVPLFGPGEEVLGSFCVIESEPRRWTDEDLEVLADAAMGVQRELDLRATIRDLNEARRQRDNLVQAIAHDIRSPLTTVMAGAEMLGRNDLEDDDRAELSAAVSRQGERLVGMALRILGDSPDDAEAHGEAIDELVRTVATARTIAGHGRRLIVDIGPDTSARLPAEPVTSIVTNLVDNALNHTSGEVRLTLHREGGEVVLVVSDDGPGYDVQAVADGRQASRGYGLGRAIVGHHVQDLGGTREVQSSPEAGTTVTVRLPAAG